MRREREPTAVRTVITGVDADGKSCVVSQDELSLDQLAPGFAMGIPYATTTSPPPRRPAGTAPLIDQGIAPGHVRWMVVEPRPRLRDADASHRHPRPADGVVGQRRPGARRRRPPTRSRATWWC